MPRWSLDIEFARAIPPSGVKPEDLHEAVEYCAGWSDYAGQSVACLCLIDIDTGARCCFMQDDLLEAPVVDDEGKKNPRAELDALIEEAELFVSFNGISCDCNTLEALPMPVVIPSNKHYDILAQIYKALGRRRKGYSLDALAQLNLGVAKQGSGADAPLLFQRGEYAKLLRYCYFDTEITRQLFKLIELNGRLKDPNGGEITIEYRKAIKGLFD